MRIIAFIMFGLFFANIVQAQVGLPTKASASVGSSISADGTAPNDNAMLDVQSPATGDGKGILVPRVTANQRTNANASIAGGLLDNSGNLRGGAAHGLIVYQTDGLQGLYFNTSSTAAPAWALLGMDGSSVSIGPSANGLNDGTAVGYQAKGTSFGAALGQEAYGSVYGAAVGYQANGYNSGAAVGWLANGYDAGAAVGWSANGYTRGAAVGESALGYNQGAAMGFQANGFNSGAAVGHLAKGTNYGAAVGRQANGADYGVAMGYNADGSVTGVAVGASANGSFRGVALGYQANGAQTNVAIGAYANAQGGANQVAIGNNVTNDVPNTVRVRGSLYLDGGGSIYTNAGIFGSSDWGIKAFTIDHPLDPENKILRHFCLEGPQVWNVYAGNVQLVNGQAVVELPDYYSALNLVGSEIYALTPVGGWAPIWINNKVAGNKFVIAGQADIEVSWTIKVLRNDPGCLEDLRRRPVEQRKDEILNSRTAE